jgi:NUMOD3 motif
MPEEHCMMLSDMRTGKLNSMYGKKGEDHPAFGNTHTDESKAAIAQEVMSVFLQTKKCLGL